MTRYTVIFYNDFVTKHVENNKSHHSLLSKSVSTVPIYSAVSFFTDQNKIDLVIARTAQIFNNRFAAFNRTYCDDTQTFIVVIEPNSLFVNN